MEPRLIDQAIAVIWCLSWQASIFFAVVSKRRALTVLPYVCGLLLIPFNLMNRVQPMGSDLVIMAFGMPAVTWLLIFLGKRQANL